MADSSAHHTHGTNDNDDWQGRAACLGMDVEIFFPPPSMRGGPRRQREDWAKSVCRRCPVIEECLAHALKHETYGIWGGTTKVEREALRRQEAHAVAGE